MKVCGSPRLKSRRHLASLVEAESFAGWPSDRFRTTTRNTLTNSTAESQAGWSVAGHEHVTVTSGPSPVFSRPGPHLLTLLPLTEVRLLGGISTPSNSDEVTYYSPHFYEQSQGHKLCTHAMALARHTHKHKSGTSWNISTSGQVRTSVILSYTIYTYLTVTVWLLEDLGNALGLHRRPVYKICDLGL